MQLRIGPTNSHYGKVLTMCATNPAAAAMANEIAQTLCPNGCTFLPTTAAVDITGVKLSSSFSTFYIFRVYYVNSVTGAERAILSVYVDEAPSGALNVRKFHYVPLAK
jgi:hypothetical protein